MASTERKIRSAAQAAKNAATDAIHDARIEVRDADLAHKARSNARDAARGAKNAVTDAAYAVKTKVRDADLARRSRT